MAEYLSAYGGEKIDELLGFVDDGSFAANDMITVGEEEPSSETCKVWVETGSDEIKNIWIRI